MHASYAIRWLKTSTWIGTDKKVFPNFYKYGREGPRLLVIGLGRVLCVSSSLTQRQKKKKRKKERNKKEMEGKGRKMVEEEEKREEEERKRNSANIRGIHMKDHKRKCYL